MRNDGPETYALNELLQRMDNLESALAHVMREAIAAQQTYPHGQIHNYGEGDEIGIGIYKNGTIQPRLPALNFSSDFGIAQTALTRRHDIDIAPHLAAADPHAGYVLESLVDAKGDLLAGTAADTLARLAVGANDRILMADSGEAAGLKWVPSGTPVTQAFGDAAAEGTDDTYARAGHRHGMPASPSGMLKTASGGFFLIPTGPSAGTVVASSATNNTYGSWVEMIASTSAAIYIVGIIVGLAPVTSITYVQLDIGTGAGGSETSIGEAKLNDDAKFYTLPFPIPVAASTRIACRTANDGSTTVNWPVALLCINQADLVPV